MQLTLENVKAITKKDLDEDLAVQFWIPAVKQEIRQGCNRSFRGRDTFPAPPSGKTNWRRNIVPEGVVDGVNVVFALPEAPDPEYLRVDLDGQAVYEGEDFDLEDNKLKFYVPPQVGSGKPINIEYLPKGMEDDEARSEEPEYPYDLGVAACWRVVWLSLDDPTKQDNGGRKARTVGSEKVEYFQGQTTAEKLEAWRQILYKYRIPAL